MTLQEFVEQNWHLVSDNTFLPGPATEHLIEKLASQNPRSLFMGKRCGKTIIATIMFPVWLWQSNPKARILVVRPRDDYAKVISSRFIEFARKMGVPVEGHSMAMQKNQLGGYRATTILHRFPAIKADVVIMDDAFRPDFLVDWQLITEHMLCRLVPGGRMIELDS